MPQFHVPSEVETMRTKVVRAQSELNRLPAAAQFKSHLDHLYRSTTQLLDVECVLSLDSRGMQDHVDRHTDITTALIKFRKVSNHVCHILTKLLTMSEREGSYGRRYIASGPHPEESSRVLRQLYGRP